MSIWFNGFPIEEVTKRNNTCLPGHIGIEILEAGDDYLKGRMPVDQRTRQPYGILHGGASVVLSETLASVAAAFVADPEKFQCVGQEINANHVRPAMEGWVYGVARPLHIGRTSQVWDVRISNEQDKLVCVSRVTMGVVPRKF